MRDTLAAASNAPSGRLRTAIAVLLMALLRTTAGAAQSNPLEIRLDIVTLLTSGDRSRLEVGFPRFLAMAFYLDERVAFEPRVGVVRESDGSGSVTRWSAGMFLPVHFSPGDARRGPFAAPGVEISKRSGDVPSDALLDFGVDLGYKLPLRERLSARIALLLRDGDSSSESVLGGSVGVSLFWR